jgi:hypothetical protein
MNKQEAEQKLAALRREMLAKEQEILNLLTPEERREIGEPIKAVHFLQSFQANGKTYLVRPTLSLERFEEFEKLQIEVGFSTDFENIFKNIRKAFDLLEEGKTATTAVILYNIMNGVKNKIENRENPVLLLCTLFICAPDENTTIYDLELNKLKIEDWKKEGIAAESFFSLAFNLVTGLLEACGNDLVNILTPITENKTGEEKSKKP